MIGNEYLFQTQAEANITTFNNYKVKGSRPPALTASSTLKNEYPEFGLDAEVIHHTEFIRP